MSVFEAFSVFLLFHWAYFQTFSFKKDRHDLEEKEWEMERETEVSGLAVSKLTPTHCSSDVANLSLTGFAFTLKHRLKQASAL